VGEGLFAGVGEGDAAAKGVEEGECFGGEALVVD